jgi:hypothetical protein
MDIIETIDDLFNQIYIEFIKVSYATSDNIIDSTDINKKMHIYLMQKKREVLCASASNPMNTEAILYSLTAKRYNLK